MIQENKNIINSEIESWELEMKSKTESFDFISIDFLVDVREAQKRYLDEYKNDVDGIKTSGLSFSQWLDYKKFQATDFYLKNSNYYLGF